MGRLKGSLVYLAGPIDYANDFGVGWRRDIIKFLIEKDIVVIDPTDKPVEGAMEESEQVLKRRELKNQGKFEEVAALAKEIRCIDLRFCDLASWAIAYLDYDVTMTGTLEEIFTLNRSKKPVLVFCKQGLKKISDWLWGTLPTAFFFDDWNKLKEYIIKINDKNEELDFINRWQIIDFSRLTIEGQKKHYESMRSIS